MEDLTRGEVISVWKAILALWGSVSIAIAVAVYFTHDMRCLWFLIIPACIRIEINNDKEREGKEKER